MFKAITTGLRNSNKNSNSIISGKTLKNRKTRIVSFFAVPAIAFTILKYSTMTNSSLLIAPQPAPTWNWTPEGIVKDAESLIKDSNRIFDNLAAISSPTVENFIVPYMNHENKVSPLINQLTFLQHVSADKDIRDSSMKATELIQNFEIEASLRKDLFIQFDKIWTDVKDNSEFNEKSDSKNYESYRFIEKCHKDFIRSGLNLSDEKREIVKDIQKKIASNSLNFSKNLGEQKEFIAFTKEELDGVSDAVMEQFEKFKDEKTGEEKFKVTFKYPDILPVLKSAKNPNTRKLAFNADQNKVPENEALFVDTLKLRNDLSTVLDYSNYANYNLEMKMAKNEETVFNFLDDLKTKLRPLGLKEIEILKQLKEKDMKELNLPYDNHYYIWDHRYYDNKYLKDNFNVDLEKISEYYPIESSIDGMLKIYETVMKLKFVEETDPAKRNVWHEDVKQLSVWKMDNPDAPEFIGWIYFDLHPRDGKYGHAANFGISSSYVDENDKRSYPVTALVCNFSKPTSDKPSLLKHNELTTFFHELGHGIHDLVGANRCSRLNGPGSVPWDFVEAPSQMLEFWTWNKNELISLSKHYKTGEKIPESLIESLVSTKHVNGALFALRQLHFSTFDMEVHTAEDVSKLNLLELWNGLREQICLVENGDEMSKGYDSFGHIMSGAYSAGYYGYMWAEVFATDMYYTKFAADPLNSKSGVEYRDIILSRGGIYEVNDNLEEFLGREPNNSAFLKEMGLN
ncbi:hypothetical protein Kpol_2002p12 [Vanderwaltozyma polyspora DSM 70294]|uniref:Peptidase M3A/M3B catalytic domain-containing protein n=1 Tax=Vanderwaltozyma polyspora (strain ATCC 22028 / DSM 70294 / BCRC 21397 / CBS 2163 / NBRC 10782 / NRRL Y-8283 / UCD 57-17) TaxID=436907 RepID=A7TFC8_VANPO|nr:uncharacterized protein Kpol_2002p12 [Vanderwaltozyma polyspora DSM 70294]EDO18942.1 hypothetical protein Kpol_2002p12 [Vanderwaltozyma polyspora DSM 70294]